MHFAMNLLHVCVVCTLCVALVTQVVFSAPTFGQDMDTLYGDSQFQINPDMAFSQEQTKTNELFGRSRRQLSQMYASRGRVRGGRRGGRFQILFGLRRTTKPPPVSFQ